MKRSSLPRRAASALRSLVGLGVASLCALAPTAQAADPQVPGNVLLRLRSTSDLAPVLAQYQLGLLNQFGARPIYRVQVLDGSSVADKVAALRLEPDVLAAEPNFQHSSPEARRNVVWAIGDAADYAAQWAPTALRLPQAHLLSRGAGVRVAVLDTGVDTAHPALAGKLLPGRDFVDRDNDPSEVGTSADEGYGHGTHVAGLVSLAAPDAKIVPLRVLNPQGAGDVWTLAEAVLYAIDPDGNPNTNDGAHVINLSMGTLDQTSILDTIMHLSTCSVPDPRLPANDFSDPGYNGDKSRCRRFSGAVIVAAAGNGGSRSERQYPAAEGVYGLIPMGASNEAGRMASFSNFGTWIDLAAPGDKITSTIPGGLYGTWSGTSMAAPLAAGTAALVRARNPRMKPVDVAKQIDRYATPMCNTNILQVNAEAALKNRRPADPNCP